MRETIVIHCDVEAFWQAMCKPGFIRQTTHTGRNGPVLYVTDEAPEGGGFLAGKLAESIAALRGNRPWWKFW